MKQITSLVLVTIAMTHFCLGFGKNYYFDPEYKGQSTGSFVSPFQNTNDLKGIKLEDGDSIFFKGGAKFKGPLMIDNVREKHLFFSSYGQGRAIIEGENGIGIKIINSEEITISKLNITGNGRMNGNTQSGCFIVNSEKIVLSEMDIKGFQKSGIDIFCSKNIKVSYCMSSENGMAGIMINGENKNSSKNIWIDHCIAYNNPGDPTNLTNHSGNGILAGNCTNVCIDHCEAFENGWDMPRIGNGPVGIWTYESDSVTIQNCISHHNRTAKGADDGGGFDLDGGVTNAIIQNCLSYENEGAGYGIFQYSGASPWRNNIIRNCVSKNDGRISRARAGVFIWNNSEDKNDFSELQFVQNKIENSHGAAIRFLDESKHMKFYFLDNIFISKLGLASWDKVDKSDKFERNDWKTIE